MLSQITMRDQATDQRIAGIGLIGLSAESRSEEASHVISQTAEYALRAVVWLANRAGTTQSTQEIAKGTHAPAGYLARVLQDLARAGLVESSPGRTGGFLLRRRPSELSALEVVNAVEPIRRITECPLGIQSHHTNLCPLHRRMDEVFELMEQGFRDTTIAQLLSADERDGSPLCRAAVRAPAAGALGGRLGILRERSATCAARHPRTKPNS